MRRDRALGLPVDRAATAWGAFALVFVVYLITMARDIGIWDSGILALVAIQGGVAHPPGAPLHTWLGFLFSHLPFIPPLVGVGLVSALPAAMLTIPVLSLAGNLWPTAPDPSFRARWAPPVVVVALCLHPSLWDPATRVEVYSLAAFFAVWGQARVADSLSRDAARPNSPPGFFLAGLSFGLGAACNPVVAALVLVPALPSLIFLLARRRLPLRAIGTLLASGVLGLLPYLAIPLLARRMDVVAWGRPTDLASLWRHLQAADFNPNVGVTGNALVAHLLDWIGGATANGVMLWVAVGIAGWALLGKGQALGRGYGPACVLLAVLAVAFNGVWIPENPDYLGYLSGPLLVCSAGAAALVSRGMERPGLVRSLTGLLAACFLAVGLLAPPALPIRTRHRDRVARTLAEGALAEAPPGAILAVESDHWVWPLLYVQEIERQRPDVIVLPLGLTSSSWFWQHLYRRHPDLSPFALAGPQGRVGRVQRFLAAQNNRALHFETLPIAAGADLRIADVGFLFLDRPHAPTHAAMVSSALESQGSAVSGGSADASGVLALLAFNRGDALWRSGRSADAYAAFRAGVSPSLRGDLPATIPEQSHVPPPKNGFAAPKSLRGLGEPAGNVAAMREMLRRLGR